MKFLSLIIFFCLTFFVCPAQTDRIDTLISKIQNEQLVGVCNYVWNLKNGSKEADILIELGKSSNQIFNRELTNKLYQLLTDTSKGIVVHYILSNIWFADKISGSSFYYDDRDGTLEYEYNHLRFYENKYKSMFTDSMELDRNKKRWTVILKPMNIINKELLTKGSLEIIK